MDLAHVTAFSGARAAPPAALQELVPSASSRQRLASSRVRGILADACEAPIVRLTLCGPDGHVLVSAGDEQPLQTAVTAQSSIHGSGQLLATLIGHGYEPNLYQLVRLVARRITDCIAAEEEIDSMASEIVHTYETLHVLYDLIATVGSVLDIKSIATIIAERILEPLGAIQASVTLLIDGSEYLLASHIRAAIQDAALSPHPEAQAPLLVNGERIGTLAVRGKVQGETFHSTDLKLLDSVAVLTASALQQARLRRRELELCDQVRKDIAAAPLDLSGLLQHVAESIATAFSYALVDCWLIEGDELLLKGRHGPGDLPDRRSLTDGPCAQAALSRKPILVEDAALAFADLPMLPGIRAQMCLPLFSVGQVVGVLTIADTAPLSSNDLRLIESITVQVNIAIEHTRLLEEIQGTHAELMQASKMAAIGTLAAGVAHEFNNLLTSMQGFAELGQRGSLADKEEALEVVLRGCRRGVTITQGLLTFARPTDNRRELGQLASIADEVLRLIGRDLERMAIRVERIYESTGMIWGDATQLVQVVLNLLTNARDAMLTSGGMLTLHITEEPHNVLLRVRDTGDGIPEAMLGRIFEPFVTSKGALGGGSIGGTGLGLAVSHGIVTAHGGEIRVESRLSEGSCFTIFLPRADRLVQQPIAPDRPAAIRPPGGHLRVLIVEDEPDVRTFLSTILCRAGHTTEQAADAATALEYCHLDRWDVIVSDLTMPGMDGRGLISCLRARGDRTPVIIITGRNDIATTELMEQSGAALVLPKPFTAAQVLRAIVTVCAS